MVGERGVPVLVDVQARRGQIELLRTAGVFATGPDADVALDAFFRGMVVKAQRFFFGLRARLQATVVRLEKRCGRAPTPKPAPKPAPATGSFALVEPIAVDPPLPQREFDQFDARAGVATWTHCCDGGKWAVKYTFEVPKAVSPGNSYPIKLGIEALSYESGGPSEFQISARADGIQETDPTLRMTVNGAATEAKTLTLFVPASAKDATELSITVRFSRFTVIYNYRRTGA